MQARLDMCVAWTCVLPGHVTALEDLVTSVHGFPYLLLRDQLLMSSDMNKGKGQPAMSNRSLIR